MKKETFNVRPDFLKLMSTSWNLDNLIIGSGVLETYLHEFHLL